MLNDQSMAEIKRRWFFTLMCLTSSIIQAASVPLLPYNVDQDAISCSGFSSGGAMSTQYHVTYSSHLIGAAMLAGIPYYCAEGDIDLAEGPCVTNASGIDMDAIFGTTDQYSSQGVIDDVINMATNRVFIYTGSLDSRVYPEISDKVEEFYLRYVDSATVNKSILSGAEHGFPTWDTGVDCDVRGGIYISRCRYDGAFEALSFIYEDIARPDYDNLPPLNGQFLEYDQSEFFGASDPGLDTVGFIYVPSACLANATKCRLHLVFHGCQQNRQYVGAQFAQQTGYNDVGELNNIIMIFPQTAISPGNEYGCWDWWGYTSDNYANNRGPQLNAVFEMMIRVTGV